jgi:anti-sigma regulatory factor (Ser/Thr protein kinase)
MISVNVNDVSQVAEARREASAIARHHGFNDVDTGRVALVATELATNMLKHARGGEMLVGPNDGIGTNGIQMLALDKGRGMANVQTALADGYSSAGTAGNGLGAVIRQSSFVDIASWPEIGTAILARISPNGGGKMPQSNLGAVSVAKLGEEVCGDAWAVDQQGETTTLLVADGLGHGPYAAEAAVESVRLFYRFRGHQVSTILEYINGGLRATRGAAVSAARYDPLSRQVVFAGVGNVAGMLVSKKGHRHMVSMPGTAGYNVRKIQAFEYPFERGLIILYSDGISTSWTLDRYSELDALDPTLIAGVLYRDFSRRRDDATVLVGKWLAHV